MGGGIRTGRALERRPARTLMGGKKLHPGGVVKSKERDPGGQWQNLRGPLKGLDRNRFKTER